MFYLDWRAQTSGWSGYPSDQTDPRINLDTREYTRQEQLKPADEKPKVRQQEMNKCKMRRSQEVQVKKWQR